MARPRHSRLLLERLLLTKRMDRVSKLLSMPMERLRQPLSVRLEEMEEATYRYQDLQDTV